MMATLERLLQATDGARREMFALISQVKRQKRMKFERMRFFVGLTIFYSIY